MTNGLMLFLVLAAAGTAAAQRRETPLAQVRLPHGYYWREMYVPQATSGPSAVTWSPDGREVIYSMQGSLWRQTLGSTTATQLTSDATYDFQPDWSPDGKEVAFSSYDGRSLSLKLLDLGTGRVRTALDNGAVNVEPRWSPDGKRIAFVSSVHEGRWHVFVGDGALGVVERITEVRDSGLSRYYYSAFDHYLSPTWSPDGREFIVVSNRGRTQGTGGFWRMEARAGAPMREIHYEETTWKARPDWSRDGKRVVYSGYHGRQWNQLWLAPSERGDPVQLTYGEFDATAPRWSPDASRIAYISNEGGNTSLWILAIPGGKRERVHVARRVYRQPMATLVVRVSDDRGVAPVSARVSVRHEDGRYFAPDDAWRHADDAIMRDGANPERFEYGYWHSRGLDTVVVPAGRVRVEVWRGPEFHPVTRELSLRAGTTREAVIRPDRVRARPADGWWSGDTHVHMNYGGAYRNTPEHLAHQARAEGLSVVENLVVNKEQRIPDIGSWKPGLLYASEDLLIANGQEFHTGLWGHTSQLGLREHYLLPDYAGYPLTALASLWPANAYVLDLSRAQGGVNGYVHPFDFRPDLSTLQLGLPHELPVDVALGKVDFLEVMGFSNHLITSEVWYRLLNCGFRIPAGAGTDAFPNFAQLRGPPGLVRTYARAGTPLDHARWLDALRDGRTFVTNAPLLHFSIDGHEPGGEMRAPDADALRARVVLESGIPVEHLEIVHNGRVVASLLNRSATRLDTTVALAASPGWYVLRAHADAPRLPVLDLYPFASTSPVYVASSEAPLRCGEDADYFVGWIDLLDGRVRADTSWNTAEEREQTLGLLARARNVFMQRR